MLKARKRRFAPLVALVMLAGLSPISAQSQAAPPPDICGRLKEVAYAHTTICTHGPDEHITGGAALAATMSDVPTAPAPCVKTASEANYTSGPRIRVIFATPSDVPADPDVKAAIPGWLAQASDALRASGADVDGSYVGQDYRFYCTGSTVDILDLSEQLDPVGADETYTYDDLTASLTRLGYTNKQHDYAVFIGGIDPYYEYGGQANIENDSSANPATNDNNDGTVGKVALINANLDWFDVAALFMHEIGHNLGAVQNNAPHASKSFHCWDEWDTMCYDDDGQYFQNGGSLEILCGGDPSPETQGIWDCGKDDYYNVAKATINTGGTYLEKSWNLARSSWLTPVSVSQSSCSVDVAVSGTSFTPKTAKPQLGGCIEWHFNGPGNHTATEKKQLGPSSGPLFDSGSKAPGTTFSYTFVASGGYNYRSTGDPSTMSGVVKVPVTLSAGSGGVSTSITVTWASASTAGYRSDVQMRFKPAGGSYGAWGNWRSDQTGVSDTFLASAASGKGVYQFRAHFENATTAKVSGWSAGVTLKIT